MQDKSVAATINHCKATLAVVILGFLGSADSLADLELSGVELGVELLERPVLELPGSLEIPESVAFSDDVVGFNIDVFATVGFSDSDFATDRNPSRVELWIEALQSSMFKI